MNRTVCTGAAPNVTVAYASCRSQASGSRHGTEPDVPVPDSGPLCTCQPPGIARASGSTPCATAGSPSGCAACARPGPPGFISGREPRWTATATSAAIRTRASATTIPKLPLRAASARALASTGPSRSWTVVGLAAGGADGEGADGGPVRSWTVLGGSVRRWTVGGSAGRPNAVVARYCANASSEASSWATAAVNCARAGTSFGAASACVSARAPSGTIRSRARTTSATARCGPPPSSAATTSGTISRPSPMATPPAARVVASTIPDRRPLRTPSDTERRRNCNHSRTRPGPQGRVGRVWRAGRLLVGHGGCGVCGGSEHAGRPGRRHGAVQSTGIDMYTARRP